MLVDMIYFSWLASCDIFILSLAYPTAGAPGQLHGRSVFERRRDCDGPLVEGTSKQHEAG